MRAENSYEFFYRSQVILDSKQQSQQMSYAILDGQVAIRNGDAVIKTLGPGQFLTGRILNGVAGSMAVAYTNCLLIAVNPLLFSILAQHPPKTVLRALRLLLARPPQAKAKPQLRWPTSMLARRRARPQKRPREVAQVFETVR